MRKEIFTELSEEPQPPIRIVSAETGVTLAYNFGPDPQFVNPRGNWALGRNPSWSTWEDVVRFLAGTEVLVFD